MVGRHSYDRFGLAVKVFAVITALGFIYLQEYLYALCALPVFLLDVCISKPNRSDSFVNLFKLFLVCQGIGLWYLNTSRFFDTSAHDLEAVYATQKQFGWKNASTMLRGIGQRTLHSFVNNAIDKLIVGGVQHHQYHGEVFPVTLSPSSDYPMNKLSRNLLNATFGDLHAVDFPDLQYYTKEHVQGSFPRIFKELPAGGFEPRLKNPCWEHAGEATGHNKFKKLECLPYAYILGQPKSGTSDLFERLKGHDDIVMPSRKEVRWFTRGEFSHHKLPYEGHGASHAAADTTESAVIEGVTHTERLLGSASSVFSFTRSFRDISVVLAEEYDVVSTTSSVITIDGGPHTLWWPLQSPDGTFLYDIPATQLLREMQPDAKFIVTLTDPVRRMYSDYYFLHDNLKPLRVNMVHNKSAAEFHDRAVRQVNEFNMCVKLYVDKLKPQLGNVKTSSGSSSGGSSGGDGTLHSTTHNINSNINSNSHSNNHSKPTATVHSGNRMMPHLHPQPGDETFPLWFRAAQM